MTDPKGPPKRPSGMHRAVHAHARRVAEAFQCLAHSPSGVRCADALGHDAGPQATPHRTAAQPPEEWTD